MKLYHKSIGFPQHIKIPQQVTIRLNYTRHAQERRFREKLYKLLVVPKHVILTKDNVTEIAVQYNQLRKLTVRTSFDYRNDIVLILSPTLEQRVAKVITFWLVRKYDKSINKEKYETCLNPC